MQLMLKAHDILFHVWELTVSFLGLPPLPLVPRENTNRRRTLQQRTLWIADAHRVTIGPRKLPTEPCPRARVIDGIFTTAPILPSEQTCFLSLRVVVMVI
jgi:hypothetical protein